MVIVGLVAVEKKVQVLEIHLQLLEAQGGFMELLEEGIGIGVAVIRQQETRYNRDMKLLKLVLQKELLKQVVGVKLIEKIELKQFMKIAESLMDVATAI